MNLFRSRPEYPKDRDLVRVVQSAASRLVDKIGRLDVAPLDLSAHSRDLFENRREELCSRIERDAQVFAWSLPQNEKPFTALTVVAFHDGVGIFSLLAKECSIGIVVYHDSNDVLRCDARKIARAIGAPADQYVFGDAEEVEFVVKRYPIACDVFVSRDLSFSSGARAAPYTLTAFLNAISEESKGALSLALVADTRSSERATAQPPTNDFDFLSGELARAGFDVKKIRFRDRSRASIILAASRPAGTLWVDDRPAAIVHAGMPLLPITNPESREIQTR